MGNGGVKAAAVAEHLFAQLGPDEGAVRGVMSEGGVRTYLTLGPAGVGFEVDEDEGAITPDDAGRLESEVSRAIDERYSRVHVYDRATFTFGGETHEIGAVSARVERAPLSPVAAPPGRFSFTLEVDTGAFEQVRDVFVRLARAIRYPHRKRPGQWTDRTRRKRARRLEKARARANHEWTRRAWGRQQVVIGGRRGKRALDAWIGAL